MPTPRRAAFIITNIAARPLCGWPTSVPTAPSRSIWQVALPWMPILCSSAVQKIGLRAPRRAVGLDLELGHHEQRDALAAGRCVGQAGQHQVHDVGGQVVLAGADEDLLPGEPVGAVGRPPGSALVRSMPRSVPQCGSVRHMVPVHSPLVSLRQVHRLLLGRAVRLQALVGAVRQAGVHGPGLVGRVQHLVEALVEHDAAGPGRRIRGRPISAGQPPSHVLGVGLLEAVGRVHLVRGLVERAAFAVAAVVQRKQHLGGELAALFEHGVDGVGVDLGVARQALELGDGVEAVRAARTACRAAAGCTGPWWNSWSG